MFTLTVFEILLFECRSVLWPAQWGAESESVKISVKKQKNVGLLLKLLEKWLTYKISRFWMAFVLFIYLFIFLVLFNPFSTGKTRFLRFEKFHKLWTWTREPQVQSLSVCQPGYHWKAYRILLSKVPIKAMFTLTVFEILLFEGRSVLPPAQ